MIKDLVSIIVPVYNVEKYIEQCLESISKQSYEDIEIYLIDDGSTDRSSLMCDNMVLRDKRFSVIHQKNEGVSAARNRALQEIKGEYVVFCDADDWMHPKMIERLIFCLKKNEDVDAAFCGYVEVYEQHSMGVNKFADTDETILDRNDGVSKIFDVYSTMLWNKMFRTKLLRPIVTFRNNIYIGEDELWLIEVLRRAKKIITLPDTLYYYRRRFGSATLQKGLTKIRLSELDSQKLVLNEILEYKSKKLTQLAHERLYFIGQKLMKEAFYQGEYELFKKIDSDISDARHLWYRHHKNILGSVRRILVECMMRIRLPSKIIRFFDREFMEK